MVVETSAAVNDQNSRTLLVSRVVRNQQTGQFRLAIAVGDRLGVYWHVRAPWQVTRAVGSPYVPSAEVTI
jgi:hypothetical protein